MFNTKQESNGYLSAETRMLKRAPHRRIFLMSLGAFGASHLLSGCSGATPCSVSLGKGSFLHFDGDQIEWTTKPVIRFQVKEQSSDPSINIFRAVDASQRGEGYYENLLKSLIYTPFEIIGNLIGSAFTPIVVDKIERDPHSVTIRFSTSARTVALSEFPPGTSSLPLLVQAKKADDYRWKLDVRGSVFYSDIENRKITGEIIANVVIEQRRGLFWGKTDGDWTDRARLASAESRIKTQSAKMLPQRFAEILNLSLDSVVTYDRDNPDDDYKTNIAYNVSECRK
jgi:hypothetical protein